MVFTICAYRYLWFFIYIISTFILQICIEVILQVCSSLNSQFLNMDWIQYFRGEFSSALYNGINTSLFLSLCLKHARIIFACLESHDTIWLNKDIQVFLAFCYFKMMKTYFIENSIWNITFDDKIISPNCSSLGLLGWLMEMTEVMDGL